MGFEYFSKGEDGNSVMSYHNPRLAEIFKTKKDASEFASTFKMETQIEPAQKHFDLFDKCEYFYRKLPLLNHTLNVPYKGTETKEEILQWWKAYSKGEEDTVSYKAYRTWPHPYSFCEHLWDVQKYHTKDRKDYVHSFSIYTSNNGDFEKFKEELGLVIDFVDLKNDEGYKMLRIFDYELSEYETRSLLYKSESDCKVDGNYREHISGDLKKCFEYIRSNFYYNKNS